MAISMKADSRKTVSLWPLCFLLIISPGFIQVSQARTHRTDRSASSCKKTQITKPCSVDTVCPLAFYDACYATCHLSGTNRLPAYVNCCILKSCVPSYVSNCTLHGKNGAPNLPCNFS